MMVEAPITSDGDEILIVDSRLVWGQIFTLLQNRNQKPKPSPGPRHKVEATSIPYRLIDSAGLEESLSDGGVEGLHKQIRSDNGNKANKTSNPPVVSRVVSDDVTK